MLNYLGIASNRKISPFQQVAARDTEWVPGGIDILVHPSFSTLVTTSLPPKKSPRKQGRLKH